MFNAKGSPAKRWDEPTIARMRNAYLTGGRKAVEAEFPDLDAVYLRKKLSSLGILSLAGEGVKTRKKTREVKPRRTCVRCGVHDFVITSLHGLDVCREERACERRVKAKVAA